jgi:hypothetical protein
MRCKEAAYYPSRLTEIGAPGWLKLAKPMIGCLKPDFQQDPSAEIPNTSSEDIINLTTRHVLISPAELALALQRLQALIISHPNPGLTRRLLTPLILPLWSLATWLRLSKRDEERFSLPANNLLKILLRISADVEQLVAIIENLLYNGDRGQEKTNWAFTDSQEGGIQSIHVRDDESETFELPLEDINPKADRFIEIVESLSTDDEISELFLTLFHRWTSSIGRAPTQEILLAQSDTKSSQDIRAQLLELSVLQKMMEKLPTKLISRSGNLLDLVEGLLRQHPDNNEADSILPIVLSLLNLVLTTPGFRRRNVDENKLKSIEASLNQIGIDAASDVSATARNLALLLKYRDEVEEESPPTTMPPSRQTEDRKTYALAMSYITQSDAPAPVRTEGINLLQGLVQANSPVLDIPALLALMASLLEEDEDYINLRVIKVFTQLSERHPKAVAAELIERYTDLSEKGSVDVRLRFGEALLQVIQRLGEHFTADAARIVGESLLLTAGRRGQRPKTTAKKARDARLREAKRARHSGDEDADDEPEEEMTDEERARAEILSQIVEGWGGKEGAEDVRIRASALSILAVGIETNVAGLGSSVLADAVDLCLSVLALETEPEKGILRRSAIILILSFVRALDQAKQAGRRLGFGLTEESQGNILRILRYIAATDKDGLVKQHAEDVIESLENWRMSLVVPEEPRGPTLTRLAGLTFASGNADSADISLKPKIEEID